ncbi:MAG TPA: hypothetical protein VNA12_00985 [Mycobacteriales bacterium]|nr:hypothetical protein [Mycobacteriales bacterium]
MVDAGCVASGCDDHYLDIAVTAGHFAWVSWVVTGSGSGPGLDVRLLDAKGRNVGRLEQHSVDYLNPPTVSSRGHASRIPPGRYTLRVSVSAGVTDYTAKVELDAFE